MKKIITGLFLLVFSVLMLNVTKAETYTSQSQLPANCIAYNDWCNMCGKTGNGDWACTLKACLDQTTPTYTCTAYSTWDMSTGTAEDPIACTMQYAPVCGAVQVECVRAPCPPIKETFGNACMLSANKRATFLYEGECRAEEPTPTKACTKEYMPMCGVTIAGTTQTFGNKCTLEADNATLLYAGECKSGLGAGEWFVYGKVANILDQSYLAWSYTPIQAYNYTQTIIDKIDDKLKVSKMRKRMYDKHIQLKKFLQTYMTMQNITQ